VTIGLIFFWGSPELATSIWPVCWIIIARIHFSGRWVSVHGGLHCSFLQPVSGSNLRRGIILPDHSQMVLYDLIRSV